MPLTAGKSANSLFGALILPLVLVACSDEQAVSGNPWTGNQQAIPVVLQPVTLLPLQELVQSVGTARALKSVSVYPETSGIVTDLTIEADRKVDSGETLLRLDSRDEQLAVELAEVKLKDAERLVQRYKTVNTVNTNIAESQIDEAQANLDTARIALAQAQINLARRSITAPFSGHVGITEIDVGDRIDTNSIVTTLDDRSQLLINFSVPEVYVRQVVPGMPVDVRLWDGAQQHFSGEIVAVDSRINEGSRAFIARAVIDNSDDRFRPGMAFEIALNVSRGSFLSVPDVAVQWGADGAYIWIDNEGKADRREARLIKRLPGVLLLEGNFVEGDLVVTEGVQAVRQGAQLRALNSDSLDGNIREELGSVEGAR